MLMQTQLNSALFDIIELPPRAYPVPTLRAEVDEAEFAASKLTLPVVRNQVTTLVRTAVNLPVNTRMTLEWRDWNAWACVRHDVRQGGEAEGVALWCFPRTPLVPATMLWLGTYRKHLPELFA